MAFNAPGINPYDPATSDPTPETVPFDEIIRRAIAAAMLSLRVHMPAKITAVKGDQKVDVQILLQTRYIDGKVVTLPPIQNVMVSMPMGQGWSIRLPIKVGDTGYLIFCDRSLDVWSASSGGVVDPQDSRAHDISDPIFVPGLVPFSQQSSDGSTDMVLTNGGAQVKVQDAGTFMFTNGTAEMISLLSQISVQLQTLADTLSTDTVTVIGVPTPLNAAAQYATIKSQVQTLVESLNTLKGQ